MRLTQPGSKTPIFPLGYHLNELCYIWFLMTLKTLSIINLFFKRIFSSRIINLFFILFFIPVTNFSPFFQLIQWINHLKYNPYHQKEDKVSVLPNLARALYSIYISRSKHEVYYFSFFIYQ
jgi:hypothetical protein